MTNQIDADDGSSDLGVVVDDATTTASPAATQIEQLNQTSPTEDVVQISPVVPISGMQKSTWFPF